MSPPSARKSAARLVVMVIAIVGALLSVHGSVSAEPCGALQDLDTTNVTFRSSPSDDCAGLFIDLVPPFDVFGGTFDLLLAEGGEVTIDGVTFTLDVADVGNQSGTWTLSFAADPDTVISQDLGIVLRASDLQGDLYAVYFFDDEVFQTDDTGQGSFLIAFVGITGQPLNLAGLHVLFRDGELPSNGVPEPRTMLLLGAGLLATSVLAQRRRR